MRVLRVMWVFRFSREFITDSFGGALQVLMALEYLHRHYIAHRDVRSDNLLLNKDGVLKISKSSRYLFATAY